MINPEDAQSFVLKRLWEVGLVLGAVWAMTAAHLASMWSLEMELPRLGIYEVEREEY